MTDFIQNRQQWTASFLPEHARTLTLEEYVPKAPDQAAAKVQVQRYIDGLLSGERTPLVLYGPPNQTKTLLACCIWNVVAPHIPDRSRYDEVKNCGTADNIGFYNGAELPGFVKFDANNRRPTGLEFLEHIKTCRFCVLDDFDKAPAGNWSSAWYDIIEGRLALPTVVTMNHTPAEFARKYGEFGLPIISRLTRPGGIFIRLG